MAKRRVITEYDESEIEKQNEANPVYVAVREFFKNDQPIDPEIIGAHEWRIRVFRLDRLGKPMKIAGMIFNNIDSIYDDIAARLGSGRYNIWVEWRETGSTRKHTLYKAFDIAIESHIEPESPQSIQPVQPVEEGFPPEQIQEQFDEPQEDIVTKMLLLQQQQMGQVLLALVQNMGQRETSTVQHESNTDLMKSMMDMLLKGIEIGQTGTVSATVPEDNSILGLVRQALPLIPVLKEVLPLKSSGSSVSGTPTNGDTKLKTLKKILFDPENSKVLEQMKSNPETKELVSMLEGIGD